MDPFLEWIRVDDTEHSFAQRTALTNIPTKRIPASFARVVGLRGVRAQCREAFAIERSNARSSDVMTSNELSLAHSRDIIERRRRHRRQAFDDDDDDADERSDIRATYARSDEALRARALWLGNRDAWLAAAKSRWRAIRARRRFALASASVDVLDIAEDDVVQALAPKASD